MITEVECFSTRSPKNMRMLVRQHPVKANVGLCEQTCCFKWEKKNDLLLDTVTLWMMFGQVHLHKCTHKSCSVDIYIL